MTVAYYDTSALVKLFVEEAGSDDAAALWDGADIVLTSRIAEPEVRAALAAALRAGRLDGDSHQEAKREWTRYRDALRFVELTPALASAAGDLAERHTLGGLDAIHLASAALFTDTPLIVATWDKRLLTAARSLTIATLPAAEETPRAPASRRMRGSEH